MKYVLIVMMTFNSIPSQSTLRTWEYNTEADCQEGGRAMNELVLSEEYLLAADWHCLPVDYPSEEM